MYSADAQDFLDDGYIRLGSIAQFTPVRQFAATDYVVDCSTAVSGLFYQMSMFHDDPLLPPAENGS